MQGIMPIFMPTHTRIQTEYLANYGYSKQRWDSSSGSPSLSTEAFKWMICGQGWGFLEDGLPPENMIGSLHIVHAHNTRKVLIIFMKR